MSARSRRAPRAPRHGVPGPSAQALHALNAGAFGDEPSEGGGGGGMLPPLESAMHYGKAENRAEVMLLRTHCNLSWATKEQQHRRKESEERVAARQRGGRAGPDDAGAELAVP